MKTLLTEPSEVLFRIKRGLAGYVSYLAACDMNQAFSEYILYEPILRILVSRKYSVKCEYACPNKVVSKQRGDKKRIDFHIKGNNVQFALEVKWARKKKIDVGNDTDKLHLYLKAFKGTRAFLCIFGREKFLDPLKFINIHKGYNLKEKGEIVRANFKRTRYCCRIYELIK